MCQLGKLRPTPKKSCKGLIPLLSANNIATKITMKRKAPFTIFGETKNLPINIYFQGKLQEEENSWDEEVWIETAEEWYAIPNLSRDKKIRVITRNEWLEHKTNRCSTCSIVFEPNDPAGKTFCKKCMEIL